MIIQEGKNWTTEKFYLICLKNCYAFEAHARSILLKAGKDIRLRDAQKEIVHKRKE